MSRRRQYVDDAFCRPRAKPEKANSVKPGSANKRTDSAPDILSTAGRNYVFVGRGLRGNACREKRFCGVYHKWG